MKHNYPKTEVDEILRVPPTKLIAYSTIFVSLGLLVFFAIGLIVNIPEESEGNVRLFNSNAYVSIYANTDGRIAKLFVKDKLTVNNGDALALIHNPLAFQDYQSLSTMLEQLDSILWKRDSVALATFTMPSLNKLGSMQSSYQELQKQLQQFSSHTLSSDYAQQYDAIQKEQQIHKAIDDGLAARLNLLELSVSTKTRNLRRMQQLHASGLISDAELETVETGILEEEMKLENMKSDILDNDLKMHDCSKQLIDLQWNFNKERDELFLGVHGICEQVHQQLQLWEEKYLLRAPVSGRVQLTDFWEEQQQVNAGEIVMTILPDKEQLVSAKMQCPANQAAKVKPGNEVLIELQGHPAITHGYIRGEVKSIAEVQVEGKYMVNVVLTSGFYTTLGKTIQFNRYAEGRAKIITGRKVFLAHLAKKIFPLN